MTEIEASLAELRGIQTATQPRIEVDVTVDITGTPGDHATPIDGHAEAELSAGTHAGLQLPRMQLEVGSFAGVRRIERLDQLTGIFQLSHQGLGRIEAMRDEYGEDLELRLQLSLLGEEHNDTSLQRITESISVAIPGRDWTAVLEELGYHDQRVVEVDLPDSDITDLLKNAYGQVEKAQEHHDGHRYDDAVNAVRKALLKLEHLEDDEDLMAALEGEKQERVLEAIDEFEAWLVAFKRVTDLGSHPEEQITEMDAPPTRRDSELAIDVAKAYLRYISRVAETE